MSEWVSVDERLPVAGVKVDGWIDYGRFHPRKPGRLENIIYDEDKKEWYCYALKRTWCFEILPIKVKIVIKEDRITHWMPLPEPPK